MEVQQPALTLPAAAAMDHGMDSRNCRLAREFERHLWIAAAFIRLAMARAMLRRPAIEFGQLDGMPAVAARVWFRKTQ